jgi:hypothetical protein
LAWEHITKHFAENPPRELPFNRHCTPSGAALLKSRTSLGFRHMTSLMLLEKTEGKKGTHIPKQTPGI